MMRYLVATTVATLLTAAAYSQPQLVITGMSNGDISADGQTYVGGIYDYSLDKSWVFKFTRGVGSTNTNGDWNDGVIRSSNDGQALSAGMLNDGNWGGFGTDRNVAHRYTPTTGWVNIGSMTNGYSCDFNINTPYDISGNGQFVCGGGWTNSLCGPFRAWVYDTNTGGFTILPFSRAAPPAGTYARATRADSISDNGTVVCGYDDNYDPNLQYQSRHAAAWVKNGSTWVEVILDPWGGEAVAVSGDGNYIIGNLSTTSMQAIFGTTTLSPIRWHRTGTTTFVPEILGGGADTPTVINSDGSVIAGGGGNGWIWKTGYESPVDLAAYFASVGGDLAGFSLGSITITPWSMSADGNAILVAGTDNRDPCLMTFANAVMYLNNTTCEPPHVNFDPVDQIVSGVPSYGIISNVFAAGSWPLNYQWQKKDANDVWQDLADDHCDQYSPAAFDVKGSITSQLRLGYFSGANWVGWYRCRITNSCGTAMTASSWIGDTPPPACLGDLTGDLHVDLSDLALALSNYGLTGATPAQGDLTGDTVVDLADLALMLSLYGTICN